MDFARRTIRSFERTVFNRKNIESPVHSILYPDESVFAKPSDTDDDISEQVAPIVIPLENIKIGEGTFRATPLPQLCFFPSESRSACFRLQIRPNGPVFDLKPSASADTRAIFYVHTSLIIRRALRIRRCSWRRTLPHLALNASWPMP